MFIACHPPDGELMNIIERLYTYQQLYDFAHYLSPSHASFLSGLEEFTPPGNLTELYIPISEMMVTLLIVLAAVNVNMPQ